MVIACVAVLGRKNNPLYLENFKEPPTPLKYSFLVHASLDVFETRGIQGGNVVSSSDLGLLYSLEDYLIYGYETRSSIKFVVVLDGDRAKDASGKVSRVRLGLNI